MITQRSNPQGDNDYSENRYILFLLIGIVIIALMPLVFTRSMKFNTFDFTQTGQIGDTIGGITAPFVGILGAILVYISFNEQRKANMLQWAALNEDRMAARSQESFEFMYKFYTDEIKSFQFYQALNFSECVKLLENGTMSQNSEELIKSFIKYLNLCNFFVDELESSYCSQIKRRIIIGLYISTNSELVDADKIFDDPQKTQYYLTYFIEFSSNYERWRENIKRLKSEYRFG
jgi:hypothetical protein